MKRREFTKGLLAASLAPAVPLSALAKAAPAATLAKDPMYFWANFVSRVHNKSSPAMISRLLKIEPEHGAKLYGQLVADGSLTAPDAFGLSQSTNPLYPEFSKVAAHGKKVAQVVEKPSDNKAVKNLTAEETPEDTEEDRAQSEPAEETGAIPDEAPVDELDDEDFTSS